MYNFCLHTQASNSVTGIKANNYLEKGGLTDWSEMLLDLLFF